MPGRKHLNPDPAEFAEQEPGTYIFCVFGGFSAISAVKSFYFSSRICCDRYRS
jgi:hypothetical protein